MTKKEKTETPPAFSYEPSGFLDVREYKDGQKLYTPATSADRLFLIKAGRVRLVGSVKGEILTALLGPDEVCGKLTKLVNAQMGETAIADGEVEAWTLRGENLGAFAKERPRAAEALITSLAARLERTVDRVQGFAFREVQARLSAILLDLAEHHGTVCKHGGEFDLQGITQKDLGDLVGSSRPFASTQFNLLADAGAVKLEGRTICIRNQRKLREHAALEHIRT